jgi:hypothetical protein
MSDPTKLTGLTVTGQRDIAEALVGVVDAVFGIGVALATAGAIERVQLAAAMAEVLRQQEERGETKPFQYCAALLSEKFAAWSTGTVPPRPFSVIDGGKPDEPPGAA